MAEFNLDNIATELNNKIGKGECVRYPISKYCSEDASAWYTVYNDGWKECGGKATGVAYNSSTLVTLPLPNGFSNMNYTILGSVVNTSTTHYLEGVYFMISSNTQAKMVTSHNGGTAAQYTVKYYACGY